jgi:protein-S-isoprenylcysteine O-methyltransferase Ste14
MRFLETKIPPPFVMIAVGALMWAASSAEPGLRLAITARLPLAVLVGGAGFLIEVTGIVGFFRAKTSPDPTDPCGASTLVVTGVYRFTRNPMYLGDLLMLLGWAVYLGDVAAFALVPLFVAYIDRFQIAPEERAMSDLFGEHYAEYRSRVRRWI